MIKTDYPWFKKLVPHPHKLVVRNVSHKFVVCTAIGQNFRLMTRWFLHSTCIDQC